MVTSREALRDMLAFMDELEAYAPTDPEVLRDDVVLGRFTLYTLALIGEAARRLEPGFRAGHPEVPWSKILGLPNAVVHEYDRVSYVRVAETLTHSIPALRPELLALYEALRE